MSDAKPNLAQRMFSVMKDAKTVKKNGKNNFQNYKYAGEVDIINEIKPLLIKHGISISVRSTGPSVVDLTRESDKSLKVLTSIVMEYTLRNIDNPEDYIVCNCPGQGMDAGDKGVYKAITGAKKYFLANTFMIATGDDPEKDNKKSTSSVEYI